MQVAESNNLQHCWCCKLLDSATCIPKQVVGFRLTYLYYVDLLIRITLVPALLGHNCVHNLADPDAIQKALIDASQGVHAFSQT